MLVTTEAPGMPDRSTLRLPVRFEALFAETEAEASKPVVMTTDSVSTLP